MKNLVVHFVSCCRTSGSLGEQIVLSGEKQQGLASILSLKCISYRHEMSFLHTSTKVSGPIGNY